MFTSYERHSCLSLHLLLLSVAVCLLFAWKLVDLCSVAACQRSGFLFFFFLKIFLGFFFFFNLVMCVPEPTVSYQNTSELM